jgi:hypothetical protein
VRRELTLELGRGLGRRRQFFHVVG